MVAILNVILAILQIVVFLIIIQAVVSWLIAFNVLSVRNPTVRSIWEGLQRLTDPLYRPIRNILPSMQGFDLSPIVLLLIIYFLQQVIILYIRPHVF